MPLNYLGILYDTRDVNKRPLPSTKEMEQYLGIFTTFADELMEKPEDYLNWLIKQQENGRKVIIAGSLGAARNLNDENVEPALIKKVYSNLGFSWQGNATNERIRLAYDYVDQSKMNFERELTLFPSRYIHIVPVSAGAKSWVTVKIKNKPDSDGSVVGVSLRGGFALDGYMRWQDPVTFLQQWYLNPFEFLQQSLNLEGSTGSHPDDA